MRYNLRVDANQSKIVKAFRDRGAAVVLLHNVGQGFPDLAVNYRGVWVLVEVKTKRGRLNKCQRKFFENHPGLTLVARNEDDVITIIETLDAHQNAIEAVLNDFGRKDDIHN